MSSRNKTDVKKLFEYWCEVSRAPGTEQGGRSGTMAPSAVIVESFPENFRDEKTIADIPAFAFPCEFESDSVQSYSFVLTTDDSKWRFGFCRHDPKADSTMVIITLLPWHDTFLRLLTVLAELRRIGNGEFRTFLAEAYNSAVPELGSHLKLVYGGGQSSFIFECPKQFQLPSIPENHNLNLYYNFVDPKNMIAVFAAMLAERRIIFTSRRLDRLSSCIQAANAFLYPMVWQHIFIPVLPMKLKDYLSAPMPYLIGVPQLVLETMTADELGEVVILNCDTKIFESPFDDVHSLPPEIVSQLKKQLSHSQQHMGDRVSKIFLGVLVQLIGGYRDAVEFRDSSKTFNRDKFIESRPSHLRPFLAKMMELQIFQQFIDERLEMMNTGLGFSDEFEQETVRYAEKLKKRGRFYQLKEKTNPAVKSAVKSVKESSRVAKTAYKDLKSKFRDITPPHPNSHFRSHLPSNLQHDRLDGGYIVVGGHGALNNNGAAKSGLGHHSAPSSPVFNKRVGVVGTAPGFQYASPEEINGAAQHMRRPPPPPSALAMSSSSSHIQSNGCAHSALGPHHLVNRVASSPTVSPASSLCSSEMNLSQELQNHPLFKTPLVDRSLKPSNSLDLNHRLSSDSRTGGPPPPPPARPPPSAQHLSHAAKTAPPPSYYNQSYAPPKSAHLQHSHLETKVAQIARPTPPPPPPPNWPHGHGHPAINASQKHPPAHRTTAASRRFISSTDSSYDNPPDMQSPPVPPVPPRRQNVTNQNGVHIANVASQAVAATAAAVCAGIHRLERNCWQDYADTHLLEKDSLRSSTSSSSNNSNLSSSGSGSGLGLGSVSGSSSSASFVSAASCFSQHHQQPEPPVPAPRHKKEKESLRSLEPQYLQVEEGRLAADSVQSVPSHNSNEDTMNDLISLDDSSNTSFDLEDFDPLNQNARPLPNIGAGKKSTTLPPTSSCPSSQRMATSSISNPLYTYYTPQHLARTLQPPTEKPPPLPTSQPPAMPPPDEDFELLRKYGLDQFTLTAAGPNAVNSSSIPATTAAFNGLTNGMKNWTTFE